MTSLASAVQQIIDLQTAAGKPLAIVLAGHNGSGKSTMWYNLLADRLQIPLINADRMMMSVLPEVPHGNTLPKWATQIRDRDEAWMKVAQQAVHGFVVRAMSASVSFAIETVFSHWKELEDGKVESKIDQIRELQAAGYFVLLLFVGLTSAPLSIARVQTRVAMGGHGVKVTKLRERFPRTQRAIREARAVTGIILSG